MNPGAKACPVCGQRYDAAAAYCQRDGTRLEAVGPLSPGPGDDGEALLGQVLLGQFRLDAVLGAGGMGTVYRAWQSGTDRPVAVKILHGELAQDPEAARRFEREARVSAQIDHPNVARTLLFGRLPDGRCYLVMEYLEGPSLADLLDDAAGPLPPGIAVAIARGVGEALGEAHRLGVVHRDVKPENVVLVDGDPTRVKLLDFGIARRLWGEHTMATEAGLVFGTARYISPEGASGEPTDARSDVYSLGVLTYQMLAGRPPFDAESPVALLLKHVQERAPRLPGAVPAPLADVVDAALTKAPGARPADGAAWAAALCRAASAAGLQVPGRGMGSAEAPRAVPGEGAADAASTDVRPRGDHAVPTLLEHRREALLGLDGDPPPLVSASLAAPRISRPTPAA
ncbi:MAG TPA: serine/threonine-protein kinase, partial [Polyangiaceae bacterium LLY-WYZ-14_1]|nr:serine/threonine-protein kinase [Polyangiaceae bacterium LLY-WYZ-14_1]